MNNLFPEIIDKTLMTKKFDHRRIYESLLEETDLAEDQANHVMIETCRFIVQVSSKIKIMTSPMIREIVNVILLKNGFEKARLKYTRIGLPFHDITHLPSTYNITTHVLEEYKNVQDIIIKLEKENKNG